MKKYFISVITLFVIGLVAPVQAEDFGITGEELARRVYDRNDGSDAAGRMQMSLVSSSGKETVREMEVFIKDYEKRQKRLVRFLSPASIKGTGLLSSELESGETEQFLYLPALRRVRRVAGEQKDRNFANSDFTYEDLEGRRDVELDTHRVVGREKLLGYNCLKLESVPRDSSKSEYSKRITWVMGDTYLILRTDFYNKKGEPSKRLNVERIEEIQNIWTHRLSVMTDLQSNHQTKLKLLDISYDTGVDDGIFSKRYLEKQ
ncbi:MAG: outer membrane lipoprotein-sorting protein [bacterium]|nr:outer membrane lipoprotein-sorting protein [bacterium]